MTSGRMQITVKDNNCHQPHLFKSCNLLDSTESARARIIKFTRFDAALSNHTELIVNPTTS